MSPLRAGVPDPLPAPLLARAKAAARLWEPRFLHGQAWSRAAAREVQEAPLLVLAWPCLSFPNLKITLCMSYIRWRAPSRECWGRHELSAGLRAAGLCCARPWTSLRTMTKGASDLLCPWLWRRQPLHHRCSL